MVWLYCIVVPYHLMKHQGLCHKKSSDVIWGVCQYYLESEEGGSRTVEVNLHFLKGHDHNFGHFFSIFIS